jgi:hypothetical protein
MRDIYSARGRLEILYLAYKIVSDNLWRGKHFGDLDGGKIILKLIFKKWSLRGCSGYSISRTGFSDRIL